MSDLPKLSRRDWFRLSLSGKEKSPAATNSKVVDQKQTRVASISATGLTPIEHPPNHDGMDLSELPPMREATLTTSQVNELFGDIASVGSDILLMQRRGGGPSARAVARSVGETEQLEAAKIALLSGQLGRVQIRYRWRSSQWIDTLESVDGGFRLVRIEHRG